VVIGTDDPRARRGDERDLPAFEPEPAAAAFCRASHLGTDQYAANAFLATKITFINEIADLCEKTGADVQGCRARHRAGQAHRQQVSARWSRLWRLVLSKDTLALLKTGQDEGAPLRIVETVVAVNDARKRAMARKVMHALGGFGARQARRAAGSRLQAQYRTTCATRRRWPSSPRSPATGRKSTPTTPRA